MLADWREKFKPQETPIIVSLITILGFSLGFGLGRLSKIEAGRSPITIQQELSLSSQTPGEPLERESGQLVASKKGKKYYLPWCSGAERIKPENLIAFASAAEAQARGYAPAANCPGLEE